MSRVEVEIDAGVVRGCWIGEVERIRDWAERSALGEMLNGGG